MLVENATLLLAASDFLSEASWDSLTLPTSVLCSFVLSESLFVSAFACCGAGFALDAWIPRLPARVMLVCQLLGMMH